MAKGRLCHASHSRTAIFLRVFQPDQFSSLFIDFSGRSLKPAPASWTLEMVNFVGEH
jgi:hypothetical protein